MTRGDKLRLVAFALAAGAAILVMLWLPAAPRKATPPGAPPRSRPVRHSTSWDWRKEWQEAPRDERVKIARMMVSGKVLVGLSSEELFSALAPPRDLHWSVRRSGEWHGYVTLILYFDEAGRVEFSAKFNP